MFALQTLPTTTYELEIVAKDMAGSEVGLTGTATATITITDKNDHAPEFTHPLVRNIASVFPLNLGKILSSYKSPCHSHVAFTDSVVIKQFVYPSREEKGQRYWTNCIYSRTWDISTEQTAHFNLCPLVIRSSNKLIGL